MSIRSDRFEKAIDHDVVFQRHAQLAGESALDHCFLDHAQDEHLGDSQAAKFRTHPHRNQPRRFQAALMIEAVLTKPIGIPKVVRRPLIFWNATLISGRPMTNPTGSSVDFRDGGEIRRNSGFISFVMMLKLGLGKWNETPIVLPGVIVDFAQTLAFHRQISAGCPGES